MTKKKSSGGGSAFGILVQVLRFAFAWMMRFFNEIGKDFKWVAENTPTAKSRLDTWCVDHGWSKLDPLSITILVIVATFLIIPIILFRSIVKSF